MTSEITTIAYIGSTLVASAVYYLTFRFQAKKIDILEKAISSQSSLISDFEKFKALLDVEHYIKNRDLQLENQKLEMTRYFEKEAKQMGEGITKSMNQAYLEANNDLLGMVNELVQFPITMTTKQFPTKEQKNDRDAFVKLHYPHSASRLIDFCDAIIAGNIPPSESSIKQ